ncbi:hypothetical protein [Enterococcus termitis]|uniref:Uncharacterized protein n=1 Tax=Enterococcus termitis TaxID=332950 RepID=A0A1E5GI22_9ENTE|nr:hypothetical protein [Enterococcus termitis]OEG12354.1 hypothetical protein BCR25_07395 [Enterococcus termitis]
MSTTSKVLKKLYTVLEEKSEGITVSEFWDYLFEDKELAKELVFDGERREGIVVRLQTQIKKGGKAVEGIKIIKNAEGKNVFILNSNNLNYLAGMSNKYLKEATSIKLEVQDYVLNKSEQAIINKHEKALKELERINSDLQKLADKISEKKMNKEVLKTDVSDGEETEMKK